MLFNFLLNNRLSSWLPSSNSSAYPSCCYLDPTNTPTTKKVPYGSKLLKITSPFSCLLTHGRYQMLRSENILKIHYLSVSSIQTGNGKICLYTSGGVYMNSSYMTHGLTVLCSIWIIIGDKYLILQKNFRLIRAATSVLRFVECCD